ncbi:MAG: AraC family transcriptional regulator [Gammaproteobacteria bacterium]
MMVGLVGESVPTLSSEYLSSLPAWTRQRNQPATYPRLFVEVARDQGIAPADVLEHAGLPGDLLDDPAGRLSCVETWLIIEAVLELTADPSLGFETGGRLPLTAHGSLGYALMCAPTPRVAVQILERFWHLRGRGVTMSVSESEEAVFFGVSLEIPLPSIQRDFMFSSMLTSMWQGIRFVLPELSVTTEIWLEGDEPEGFASRRARLPQQVRFGMPAAGLRLTGNKQSLDFPLATANPEGLAHALAQCERESALMGGGADPVLQRTRAALQLGLEGYLSPEGIAGLLFMTTRTFRRHLQEQGSSYRQLLEEARRRDACRLLQNPDLEVRQVGELLGYADPANFTRAFRGWTGKAPSEWRRQGSPEGKHPVGKA